MSVKIYTMTHKKFDVPNDPMYVPLQVGAEGKEPLGYVRDNTGENISALNCYYSELTGVYWIWKNDTESDIVGVCHYRRYLLNEKGVMFRKEEIEKLLSEYDCLTSRLLTLDFSYHYGFSDNHNVRDLDVTGEVIREKYPEDYPLFEKLVHENHTYFGNICVMKSRSLMRTVHGCLTFLPRCENGLISIPMTAITSGYLGLFRNFCFMCG